MFDVVLLPAAEKNYRTAQPSLAKKLARCFAQLEADPRRHANIKRLTGQLRAFFRYRAGDHRVIYKINDGGRTVYVYKICHRREAYE